MYSELIGKSDYIGNRLCFIREVIEQYENDDEGLLSDVPVPTETITKLTAVIDSMISQLDAIPQTVWEVFECYWQSEWRSSYQDHLESSTTHNNDETDRAKTHPTGQDSDHPKG